MLLPVSYLSKKKNDKEGKAYAMFACQKNVFTQTLQIDTSVAQITTCIVANNDIMPDEL